MFYLFLIVYVFKWISCKFFIYYSYNFRDTLRLRFIETFHYDFLFEKRISSGITSPLHSGVLYIWEGLPAHIAGSQSANLTSRLLLLLSADLSLSSEGDQVTREVIARGAVTILYEGMLGTKFNISYELRNCTHNCSSKDTRYLLGYWISNNDSVEFVVANSL